MSSFVGGLFVSWCITINNTRKVHGTPRIAFFDPHLMPFFPLAPPLCLATFILLCWTTFILSASIPQRKIHFDIPNFCYTIVFFLLYEIRDFLLHIILNFGWRVRLFFVRWIVNSSLHPVRSFFPFDQGTPSEIYLAPIPQRKIHSDRNILKSTIYDFCDRSFWTLVGECACFLYDGLWNFLYEVNLIILFAFLTLNLLMCDYWYSDTLRYIFLFVKFDNNQHAFTDLIECTLCLCLQKSQFVYV